MMRNQFAALRRKLVILAVVMAALWVVGTIPVNAAFQDGNQAGCYSIWCDQCYSCCSTGLIDCYSTCLDSYGTHGRNPNPAQLTLCGQQCREEVRWCEADSHCALCIV
jgi:hypothetical protein